MAIHSFCHLEEPVPQNNDPKKAHLFARKGLHLGISTDAAKKCFLKFRSLTFSGMRISEQTTGDFQATVQVWVACQKSILKPEHEASRVLMMNMNGYLKDNNGYGNFKSSGILKLCTRTLQEGSLVSVTGREMRTRSSEMRGKILKALILPLDLFKWTLIAMGPD